MNRGWELLPPCDGKPHGNKKYVFELMINYLRNIVQVETW